jgi:hypothetical protein
MYLNKGYLGKKHYFVKIVKHSILHSTHCLLVVAHQNLKGHILLNLPLMHCLQLLQLMLFHPYHLMRQFLLVGLLMLLFLLSYLFIQQFLLGWYLMQPHYFHHLGNLVRMITYMSTFPQCQIWLSIWMIFLM